MKDGTEGYRGKKKKKMSVRNRSEWKYFENDRAGGQEWKMATIEILLLQSIKAWTGHGLLALNPCSSTGSKTIGLSLCYI